MEEVLIQPSVSLRHDNTYIEYDVKSLFLYRSVISKKHEALSSLP